MTENRLKELEALRKNLDTIDLTKIEQGPAISTGVIAFDLAMGGGFPEGRFCEVFGEWQSGKSWLMYQAIAACQKAGGIAMLFDAERALEKRWVRTLGINLEELFYYTPEHLEDAFKSIEKAVRTVRKEATLFKDCPILIVYDSLAASIAKEEANQDFGTPEMALRARVISSSLRKMTNLIADHRVSLVFVNQLRSKVGVLFGPTEDTTGGRAPKFYATLRIVLKKRKRIQEGNIVAGMNGELEVVKSKVGVPFKKVPFQMMFNRPIDQYSGLLNFLISQEIMPVARGGWYVYRGERFRGNAISEVWSRIKEDVSKQLRGEELEELENQDISVEMVEGEIKEEPPIEESSK